MSTQIVAQSWKHVPSVSPQLLPPPPHTAIFWRADSRKKPLKDSAKRSACKRLAAECQVASGKRVRVRVAFALASDSDYECECVSVSASASVSAAL